MRAANNQLSFSPSDVTDYLECEHLTQLELKVARGEIVKPDVEDAQAELIRRKGDEHERAYLELLLADGRDVVTIELAGDDGEWDWERASRETADAIQAGREVVYQAAFLDGEWRGLADFVIRGPDGSYEAYDTKLARHGKPAHVLQLCFYSEQIGRLQGRLPERMHIALGSGATESYRVLDFLAYYRRVRERFLDAVHNPRPTEPWPVAHCGICDFRAMCEEWWDAHDHSPASPTFAATRSSGSARPGSRRSPSLGMRRARPTSRASSRRHSRTSATRPSSRSAAGARVFPRALIYS